MEIHRWWHMIHQQCGEGAVLHVQPIHRCCHKLKYKAMSHQIIYFLKIHSVILYRNNIGLNFNLYKYTVPNTHLTGHGT